MSDREAILARVREAIAGAERPAAAPRAYPRTGDLAPEARVELFCERVRDYRVEVQRLPATEVARAVAAACARLGAQRLVA